MSKDKLFCGIFLALVTMAFAGASLMLNRYPSTTTLVVAGSAVVIVVLFRLRRHTIRRRQAAKKAVAKVRQDVIIDRDLMIDTNPATNPGPTCRIDHFTYDPTARELVLR